METVNNRWWETYLVRYITGSVVGAVIVHLLLKRIDVNLVPDYSDIKTGNLLVLSVLGFAYCYIASAPITLLHAVRAMNHGYSNSIKSDTSDNNFGVFAFLPIVIIVIAIALWFFFFRDNLFLSVSGAISILALASLYTYTIIQYKKTDNNKDWQRWYMKLASKRAIKQLRVHEYVQSYRHLREHGNAFLIIFLEISFGIVMYCIEWHICFYFDETERQILITILYGVLIFWISSGAICWYLGNKLEKFLIDS